MFQLPKLKAVHPGSVRRCELVKGDDIDTLYIYGIIGTDDWAGDSVDPIEFSKALRASKAPMLHLRINSPGGDVFAGVAMAQALRDYRGELVVYVDGLAASAATFLTTAAPTVLMAKGSMLMVHRAWTFAMGNAGDLRKQADLLDKIDGQISTQYAERAGVPVEQALAWMEVETWFTEDEAVSVGLADGLQPEESGTRNAVARIREWDLGNSPYARVPGNLVAPSPHNTTANPRHQLARRLAFMRNIVNAA